MNIPNSAGNNDPGRYPFAHDPTRSFIPQVREWVADVFYDILPDCGFEVREEQIFMAYQLEQAFADKRTIFAEAGVGTGKTLVCLVVEHRERTYPPVAQDQKTDVVLRFAADTLAMALDRFYDADKSFNDGSLTMTLRLANPADARWLGPVLLSFGDGVEIIEPLELRKIMKTKLEKMLRRYSEV